MRLSVIVAIGRRAQIGLENRLLWHIPEDLKLFKTLTTGHCIIMGRKTYESIGKPLPNRTLIVLSRSALEIEGAHVCKSLDEAVRLCEDLGEDEAFVIGGGEVYREAMKICDRLYLSNVDYDGPADTYFVPVIWREWQVLDEQKYPQSTGKNGEAIPAWQHFVLERLPHSTLRYLMYRRGRCLYRPALAKGCLPLR
jgi:dihydrofolate reductase